MRKLLAITVLSLTTVGAFAQSTPSDLKRSELELEPGNIKMPRATLDASVGAGKSQSDVTGQSYTIRDVKIQAGTKLIMGNVQRDESYGVAISPDLKLNFRLDENAKKIRLEVGGQLISLFDYQSIWASKNILSESDRSWIERRIDNRKTEIQQYEEQLKERNLSEHQKSQLQYWLENAKEDLRRNQVKLEEDDKAYATRTVFATIDLSAGNLGAKHQEIKDALFKFTGVSGSALAISFDLEAKLKNAPVTLGLCGIGQLGTFNGGRFSTIYGEKTAANLGYSGSVCARIGIGPVTLSNTFSARQDHGFGLDSVVTNSAISNSARLAVSIPKTPIEVGAFHTYSREDFAGGKVESNIVGGGVTVLAK